LPEGGHIRLYRDIGRKNPFPRAQGKRGHPGKGVRSPRRKGFYREQGDLRSSREIRFEEYITREGIQRKELRAYTEQGFIGRWQPITKREQQVRG
jgi:hypothetical protein